jgi:hypothetical protein
MAQIIRWKGDTQCSHSKTIPQQRWGEHQAIIIEKYASMTLMELKQWMEENRGFSATYDFQGNVEVQY